MTYKNKFQHFPFSIIFFKQLSFNFFKKLSLTQILRYFDYCLLVYIIFSTILALVGFCGCLVESMSVLPYGFEDSVLQMNNRGTPDNYGFINPGTPNSPGGPGTPGGFPPGVPGSHHTNVHIIHDDGNWANGIRNLFIYGSGGARLIMSAQRGGGPAQRFFIISTTILAETTSRLIINSLNDPGYLRAQASNIRAVYHENTNTADVHLNPSAEQSATGVNSSSTVPVSNIETNVGSGSSSGSVPVPEGSSEISKSMMGIDIDLAGIRDSVLNKIVNYLNYIFEPVQHSFTIDVMSNHIQNISILLFILTAIIVLFFISFLFNLTLFLFSDRLIRYFTNKYII